MKKAIPDAHGMDLAAHKLETQKAYKKAKKKRAKAKRAAIKNENKLPITAEKPVPAKWHRVGFGENLRDCPKATNRPVDEAAITKLLEKRSQAKAEKNYALSDEVTATLVEMEIVYDDQKKQWHTRLLSTVAQKAKEKMKLQESKKRESEAIASINSRAASKEPAAKKSKKN